MNSKLLQPSTAAADIEALELQHSLEDASGATYERVVWKRSSTIKLHDLDDLGLAESGSQYPSLHGIHVGDADFWFNQLVQDYSRAAHAWVIEITPIPGDHITDDPQHRIPDIRGNKASSQILITERTVLREGDDFEYVRELDATDLPEPEDSEDDGYDDDGEGYDDDDDE